MVYVILLANKTRMEFCGLYQQLKCKNSDTKYGAQNEVGSKSNAS